MCAGICAGECEPLHVDVCRSSSVNIVLCSSNSSSSGSAVAARPTVYFPLWRTTSYQISRRWLLACCPTTHSRRIYRPLSSACSWWLTARWTTHTAPVINSTDDGCNNLLYGISVDLPDSHTEQMWQMTHCFLPFTMAAPTIMTERWATGFFYNRGLCQYGSGDSPHILE